MSILNLCLVLATSGIDGVNRYVTPMGYHAELSNSSIGFVLERLK